MENWWKKHSGKSDDQEWNKWLDKFEQLLEEKIVEWRSEHVNEVDGVRVFGMSKSAGCTRDLALNLLGHKEQDLSGSSLFTFWLGHVVEVACLATLVSVGYELEQTQSPCIIYDETGRPLMKSTSDGITRIHGIQTIVSVKSAAYKMSGLQRGKWIRRGFAELPFIGFAQSNTSGYVQLQNEMYASGIRQGLVIVASKDIVKAFENDPYLGNNGNGSLTFYTELIQAWPEISEKSIEVLSNQMDCIRSGVAGPAMYVNDKFEYIELEQANVIPSNIWGGINKDKTGKFNPCGGCNRIEACRANK